MKIYARKIFPHDITHEVSLRKEFVYEFFEGNCDNLHFIGKKSQADGIVTINDATDTRFGGSFKRLLINEGDVSVNNIVLIYKLEENNYEFEIVREDDLRYFSLLSLFREKKRHALIEIEVK